MKKKAIFWCVGFLVICLFIGCEQQAQSYETGKAKAWQIEPKMNLHAMFAAQVGFKALEQRFATSFDEMGFSMTGQMPHHSYFMGQDMTKGSMGPDKLPAEFSNPIPGADAFVIWAVGNLDSDPDLDIWKIDQDNNLQNVRNDTHQTR